MRQLPLGIRLQDRAVFASFVAGENALALDAAQRLAVWQQGVNADSLIYLHGAGGTGKSHLLQAICAAVSNSSYLPLQQLQEYGAGILEGVEHSQVIAVDDLDAVAGKAEWERRLFSLYNDCQSRGSRFVVAAKVPALHLQIALPDLRSRLAAMPQFALRPLDELQQREALQRRAAQRGLDLPEETVIYLQRHFARDMAALHELLDKLDIASLQEQRRLTVPFIRGILERP